MPVQALLTVLNRRDNRQDRKVVLNAVVKHLEQESCRVKHPFEMRNPGFTNVFFLFRDFLVAKSLPRA